MLARRALLGSTMLGALALAGCGVRLEDGVTLPLVPPRTPLSGEAAMLRLLQNTRDLSAALVTSSAGYAAPWRPVLSAQAASLAQTLAAAGVPTELLTPKPSATSTAHSTASQSPTPGPSVTPTAAPVALAPEALAVEGLALAADLGSVTGGARPAVVSVLASRWALLRTMRGTDPALSSPEPGTWPDPVVTALITATREAVYGFEIVTAQSGPAPSDKPGATPQPASAQRTAAAADLASLHLIEGQLSALATTLPPAALGYDLPFAVNSPASAKKLAMALTSGLRTAYGRQLTNLPAGEGAMSVVVPWLGRAEWMAHTWGNPWAPFPGLRLG